MEGIDTFVLLCLLGAAVEVVFILPKAERSLHFWPVAANWILSFVLLWLGLVPLGALKLLLVLVLTLLLLALKLLLWRLTRSPRQWELARHALLGPVGGGGNASAEARLTAPAMLYDRKHGRIIFRNRLNGYAQYLLVQPGEGWRGRVARVLL